jgi:4-aminobutyrate aminotransferase-like enzyme
MTKDEIILANKEHLFPAVFHYFDEPLVIDHAKDQYVWDADGNQYLDFFGGIVTISVGHLNDQVRAKVHEQLDKLWHVSTVFANEPQAALAKKLAAITPNGALTKSFFTNSGTEANETAITAARCYTGNSEVIALRHAYHGRSSMALTLTAQASWRMGQPPQAGIVHAHNAYCYRCPFGLTYPQCEVQCAKDVDELIRTTTTGRVAAFIAEPIQGVGGFITPPKEYFKIIADTVRQYGGIFISDEVQTGWGRTGEKWFGIEQWGVQPDIITSAKGLGNGLPIGLTIARPEVANAMKGITISTFGGNPLSTTAAKAVLDFIEENNIRKNTAQVGDYLHGQLLDLKEKHQIVGDVRGMGLLQAIELVEDRRTKKPATQATTALMALMKERRVLMGKGGLMGNCIRMSPPMNISKSDVDAMVTQLDGALAQVSALAQAESHTVSR